MPEITTPEEASQNSADEDATGLSPEETPADDTATPNGDDHRFVLWRRMDDPARRAVDFAFEEAERLGASMVSPEHILLGLVFDDSMVAAQLLIHMGKPLLDIRAELQRQVGWDDFRMGSDLPLSAQTKQVIDRAYDEARQLSDQSIGTEHLLIGLLREGTSLAAHVLFLFEVSPEQTRATLQLLREQAEQEQADSDDNAPAVTPSFPKGRASAEPLSEPRFGDLGTIRGTGERTMVEITLDAPTYVELVGIFRARDAHGYRALYFGHQTMYLIPAGTRIKRLVPPPDSGTATAAGGYYIRVLEGDYQGYAGWLFSTNFARTGPDEAPFPPPLE